MGCLLLKGRAETWKYTLPESLYVFQVWSSVDTSSSVDALQVLTSERRHCFEPSFQEKFLHSVAWLQPSAHSNLLRAFREPVTTDADRLVCGRLSYSLALAVAFETCHVCTRNSNTVKLTKAGHFRLRNHIVWQLWTDKIKYKIYTHVLV